MINIGYLDGYLIERENQCKKIRLKQFQLVPCASPQKRKKMQRKKKRIYDMFCLFKLKARRRHEL